MTSDYKADDMIRYILYVDTQLVQQRNIVNKLVVISWESAVEFYVFFCQLKDGSL